MSSSTSADQVARRRAEGKGEGKGAAAAGAEGAGAGGGEVVWIGRGESRYAHRRIPRHCVGVAERPPELPQLERMLRGLGLSTVCEEARCPNRNQCWSERAVTFMLMGSVCTRACRFCSVATGRPPAAPDPAECAKVAAAAETLGLRHVVLTSVNRDDLPDGGAAHFAATVRAIRERRPESTVEVLTPDFQGDFAAVATLCDAAPEVFNHNVETVPALYRSVRPGARFERSLAVLAEAKRLRPDSVVKSGLMVGLGETRQQVRELLEALRGAGVDSLTVGQYLRPTRDHLAVERYWEPEEFDALASEARGLGFAHVASGPLIRSSYNAEETLHEARSATQREARPSRRNSEP
ncbi:MAG: lipoyl synthase [Deltaproteobacteria bacterium]|nr:lipoyl synthase [Deltaproteobacteria bacterium]